MGKLPPQPPVRVPPQYRYQLENNDPGPNEPIWKGVVKIGGIVLCAGTFIFGMTLGLIKLSDSTHKQAEVAQAEHIEKGLVADVQAVYDKKGGWQFEKFTFEGHTYLWRYQAGFIHLESCPCRTKGEKQ